MGRPNTTRIGAPSAGSLSAVMQIQLPNQWVVEVPYQRCISSQGIFYEGVGVPPEMQVALSSKDVDDICIKTAVNHFMHLS